MILTASLYLHTPLMGVAAQQYTRLYGPHNNVFTVLDGNDGTINVPMNLQVDNSKLGIPVLLKDCLPALEEWHKFWFITMARLVQEHRPAHDAGKCIAIDSRPHNINKSCKAICFFRHPDCPLPPVLLRP